MTRKWLSILLYLQCSSAVASTFRAHTVASTHSKHQERRQLAETTLGIGVLLLVVAVCCIILIGCVFYCCLNCQPKKCFRNRSVLPSRSYRASSQMPSDRSPTSYNPRPRDREDVELVQTIPRMLSTSSEDR